MRSRCLRLAYQGRPDDDKTFIDTPQARVVPHVGKSGQQFRVAVRHDFILVARRCASPSNGSVKAERFPIRSNPKTL
jgi:hypothetical protein